ncbi:DNA polymerase IV [Lentzea sp. BCCO 10_0856]|uniref:DNA polymerase IV n=1 Tax=Lentzea miocenica TaxID=3095431 RepID=A0ABU4TBP9_9PSEU|nr:DNA polymerase IV [Lentzea sp. BCCO 10_0856]MDX8035600.1 DNA polymerase IV [Lentzea sp. BCCO 10_0856]
MADDWVLHVDLDQFIAAVEVLRDPSLRGKPVVVGGNGDPTERAVVATASYEAREFGVHSGMPLRTAFKKLPDAIFLPADHALYEAASADVMAVLRSFPVVVEVMGWDEAFVGATVDDPVVLARSLQAAVLESTGLHCSVGIGDNKLRAKIATDFGKPAGVFELTRANWAEVMGHRPTSALWGIGAKTERKLAELGFSTVAELASASVDALAARFGPRMGPYYRTVALGAGDTVVSATPWVVKSRSHEKTFQQDLASLEDIRREVVALAHQVAVDVVAEGRPAVRVGVKVRFVPFFTKVRAMKLPAPTSSADELAEAALTVLDRFEHGRAVRLLGVRAEFSADDVEPKPSPSTYP